MYVLFKYFSIIIFLIGRVVCHAQNPRSLSSYEKTWACFHPIAAIKIKGIAKKIMPIYIENTKSDVLDSFENGGKLDAFRHTFFMAAFAQKIKAKKVRKLSIAHEKGNYKDFLNIQTEHGEIPDSLSTVMDIFNNNIGIEAGKKNPEKPMEELKEYILNLISEGKVLYFKRNTNGDYLTCDGNIIVLKKFEGKWFVPKCLISSNNK